MADVMMELNGARRRVPADRVEYFRQKGATVIPDAAPTAPASEPGLWQQAREGVKSAGRAVAGAARQFNDFQSDIGNIAIRGATLGLDDVAAGAGAALGAGLSRMGGFDGGQTMGEAYDEGVAERRAEVEAAKQRRGALGTAAEVGGALLTAPLAAARGGRVAQLAAGGALGAVGGAGMGDADTLEDAAADALIGGGIGVAGAAVAPMVARGAQKVGQKLSGALTRSAPAAPSAPAVPFRQRAADVLEEVAESGPIEAARKRVVGKLAEKVRGAPPAAPAKVPEATTSPMLELGDDALDDMLRNLKGPEDAARMTKMLDDRVAGRMPADDELLLLTQRKAPPAPAAPATTAPPAAIESPDDVMAAVKAIDDRPKVAPVPPPPAPAAGPAGEVLTDLRRSSLGRVATQEEIRRAIEAVAIREGTTDIATLSNQIGLPTTKLRDVLVPMLRDYNFRQAVAAGRGASQAGAAASSAADEALDAGRVVREAKGSARSPVDNVSGRGAGQVAAVRQQEQWRAAYDRLPPEQRANFIDVLRKESGLSDDVLRRRLKMTKAEWRRTSFTRSQAASPGP